MFEAWLFRQRRPFALAHEHFLGQSVVSIKLENWSNVPDTFYLKFTDISKPH